MSYLYIKSKEAARELIKYVVESGKNFAAHTTTFEGIADALMDEYHIDSDATDISKVLVYTSLFEIKVAFPLQDVEFETEFIRGVFDLLNHLDRRCADKNLSIYDSIEFRKDVAYLRECLKNTISSKG
jgi:hypothetical protein